MPSPRSQPERSYRLSPTDPDPIASLAIWGVDILSWRIPPVDAATWLQILLAEELDLEAIFPGLCDGATKLAVNLAMLNGELGQEELGDAIMEALEEVSGRRWWIVLRQTRIIRTCWEVVGGLLAARNVNPQGVPLGWWLDAAYSVLINRLAESDPKKAAELSAKITALPPNVAREVDDLVEGNAFLAAMRAAG